MGELKTKVEEWISKEGYPLEMQVAQIFQEAGYSVTQSDYYEDFETGKHREIDVTASRLSTPELQYIFQPCRVECRIGPSNNQNNQKPSGFLR
jgi:hypothetical protein